MGWEIGPASTQTTSATPEYRKYFDRSFQEASNMLDTQGIKPYDGQRYAALNDQQKQILQATIARGQAGNSLTNAAQNGLQSTVSGGMLYSDPAMAGYNFLSGAPGASAGAQDMLMQTANGSMLNGNPYMDAMFNKAAQGVTSGVQSTFAKAGRTGSGLAAATLGDSLGSLASNMYGQNYANERSQQIAAQQQIGNFAQQDRQQQLAALQGLSGTYGQERTNQIRSAALSPVFAAEDLTNLQAQLGAAGAYQTDSQNQIAADMAKYYEVEQRPYNALSAYNSFLSGMPYSSTTSATNPQYYSTAANILGGAMGAASIYKNLGGYQGMKDIYSGVSSVVKPAYDAISSGISSLL